MVLNKYQCARERSSHCCRVPTDRCVFPRKYLTVIVPRLLFPDLILRRAATELPGHSNGIAVAALVRSCILGWSSATAPKCWVNPLLCHSSGFHPTSAAVPLLLPPCSHRIPRGCLRGQLPAGLRAVACVDCCSSTAVVAASTVRSVPWWSGGGFAPPSSTERKTILSPNWQFGQHGRPHYEDFVLLFFYRLFSVRKFLWVSL